jgi:hypothetical protein
LFIELYVKTHDVGLGEYIVDVVAVNTSEIEEFWSLISVGPTDQTATKAAVKDFRNP